MKNISILLGLFFFSSIGFAKENLLFDSLESIPDKSSIVTIGYTNLFTDLNFYFDDTKISNYKSNSKQYNLEWDYGITENLSLNSLIYYKNTKHKDTSIELIGEETTTRTSKGPGEPKIGLFYHRNLQNKFSFKIGATHFFNLGKSKYDNNLFGGASNEIDFEIGIKENSYRLSLGLNRTLKHTYYSESSVTTTKVSNVFLLSMEVLLLPKIVFGLQIEKNEPIEHSVLSKSNDLTTKHTVNETYLGKVKTSILLNDSMCINLIYATIPSYKLSFTDAPFKVDGKVNGFLVELKTEFGS